MSASEQKGYMIVDGVLADNTNDIALYIDTLDEDCAEATSHIAAELRTAEDVSQQQDLYFALAEASSTLSKAPVAEFEPAYNLLLYVLQNAPDFNALLPVILSNLTREIPTVYANQLVTLAVLGNLFNIMDADSPKKLDVFVKIVDFTKVTGTLSQLVPQFTHVKDWVKEWGVDVAGREELYTKIVDMIEVNYPEVAFELLLDASKVGSGPKLAARLVQTALESSSIYSYDEIMEIPAVKDLEQSNKSIYDLLVVVNSGDYAAFTKTEAKSNAKITSKVRALALASLAQSERSLPYSSIASATGVSENEVEILIIDSIKAKLLEGRMDQLNSQFIVERAGVVGEMGQEQWKQIDSWLTAWKKNLTESREAIKNANTHVERLMV